MRQTKYRNEAGLSQPYIYGVASCMVAGMVVLGGATGARAQEAPHPQPFRIQISGVFPTDSTAKDVLGDALFGGGFSFDLPNKASQAGLPSPVALNIYFSGSGSSRTKNDLRVDGYFYGIGVGARFYPGAKTILEAAQAGDREQVKQLLQKPQFYLGGGLGGYYQEYRVYDEAHGFYTYNNGYTVKFGGKVILGVDFGKLLFLEGGYTMPGNTHLNNWNASLGVRF